MKTLLALLACLTAVVGCTGLGRPAPERQLTPTIMGFP